MRTNPLRQADEPASGPYWGKRGDEFGWFELGSTVVLLLAQEAGIDTCSQEYWSVRHGAVREFVGAPDEELLFCGMASGHADCDAPINQLESERMPLATSRAVLARIDEIRADLGVVYPAETPGAG